MKAKEAIQEFIRRTGLPESEVKVADRALAEADMRSKGRGPKPPDLTIADGVRLLIGLAGARFASRANEYAADAWKFQCWSVTAYRNCRLPTEKEWHEALGASQKQIEKMSLGNALVFICYHLGKVPEVDGLFVNVVVRTDGPVNVAFEFGEYGAELRFNGAVDAQPNGEFRRSAEIGRSILTWIGQEYSSDDHETFFARTQAGVTQ